MDLRRYPKMATAAGGGGVKIYQDKAKRYSARKDVGNIWLSREASYRGYCAGYRAAIKDVLSLTESLMGDADRVLYEPYIKQILTDTEQ